MSDSDTMERVTQCYSVKTGRVSTIVEANSASMTSLASTASLPVFYPGRWNNCEWWIKKKFWDLESQDGCGLMEDDDKDSHSEWFRFV